ncbi:hypothetical protein CEE39_00850 [bacterium (candidate division B38) B3_B38]|nr:MAG: hypothetical protein CEE39_00850 [bacterium (candidate division B38) B3_B38]
MARVKIVHLSDIHVSRQYFSDELGEKVIRQVNQMEPSCVVLSGDLTDDGYYPEYVEAKSYIDRIEAENKVIVPGNHDSRNAGDKLFDELFSTRYPVCTLDDVKIVGVDSSEPDLDDGHIGRIAYPFIKENLSGEDFKILVLHHHLIPVPDTGRERNIPVDAGDVLKLISELRVDLVLCGHKHVPWLWVLNGIVFLYAGTATTLRIKAHIEQSYNYIELEPGRELTIYRVSSATGQKKLVYKIQL